MSDQDRASRIASAFDVTRAIQLIHLAQEIIAKEHLCDHNSILPADSASGGELPMRCGMDAYIGPIDWLC